MAQSPFRFLSTMSNPDHLLSSYRYHLPEDRIAQNPVTPRDSAKLLVVDSPSSHQHRYFRDLDALLNPGDLLVLNDTRVIPARLFGHKQIDLRDRKIGAPVEVLLIEPVDAERWLALVRPGRRLQPGAIIAFGDPENPLMTGLIESRDEETSGRIIKLSPASNLNPASNLSSTNKLNPTNGYQSNSATITDLIHQLGQVPLPPYITESTALPEQYQTVYACKQGAVAAPTAGLHFTDSLFEKLQDKGIQTAAITLHVGIGTFRPVEVKDIQTHQMHQERIEVSSETVEKIQKTKADGGRVIAVGTTSSRALEGAATASGDLAPYKGKTGIFIYPGYQWRVVDGLITNFHLPESSLLMMVSSLIGRERLMSLYEDAIAHSYRFYSFGDAMLILPNATAQHAIS